MISVTLRCRLGNQLFQYAVGRHLAIRNRTSLTLDLRQWLPESGQEHQPSGGTDLPRIGRFRIQASFNRADHLDRAGTFGRENPMPESRFDEGGRHGFHPEVLELGAGTVLHGFFQSEKYFKAISEQLRNELEPRRPLGDDQHAAMRAELASLQSVFVHVRRSDYVGNPRYDVCTPRYFERAIEFLRSRLRSPRFFLFSDDPKWCREQPVLREAIVVESGGPEGDLLDFDLMRACRHAIIANSSFSWWAAWLISHPGKKVIAPRHWYGGDDRLNERTECDIVPGEWHRLDS